MKYAFFMEEPPPFSARLPAKKSPLNIVQGA